MPATLVPTVKTSCSANQMIGGFIEGWIKQFQTIPTKASIGVLYSQNCLETGGTTNCYNWNLGNVKYIPSANPDDDNNIQYMMLSNVWEIINGVKKIFNPPDPATWFRSFPTLADGVAFQIDFLKNHRYKNAWTAVESGNPAAFAHLLKLAKYYTAPEADYVRNMNYFFNKFMADTTFENVIKALQPTLNIDPVTQNVTVIGDLNNGPVDNIWNTVINFFKGS